MGRFKLKMAQAQPQISDETLKQIMESEKVLIGHRTSLKNYNQAKVALMAAADRFVLALNELEGVGDRKCYQCLGKAFLCRTKDDLTKDYNNLLESNKNELDDVAKLIVNHESKAKEAEGNLLELMKYVKLTA